jgi:Bacterial DNA polymerase III alpha NTPase domain
MNYDQYGQCWTTTDELFDMLYKTPDLDIGKFYVKFGGEDAREIFKYNDSVKDFYAPFPKLLVQREIDLSVEDFDHQQQSNWYMPDEYKNMDIAQWILDQCKTDAELQRVGEELLLYVDRDLIDLLKYLKYFVDTMRANNVVWGLGRGSSVASYVLYLIGVHKINSMYYDLDIREFLK